MLLKGTHRVTLKFNVWKSGRIFYNLHTRTNSKEMAFNNTNLNLLRLLTFADVNLLRAYIRAIKLLLGLRSTSEIYHLEGSLHEWSHENVTKNNPNTCFHYLTRMKNCFFCHTQEFIMEIKMSSNVLL